MRLSLNIIDRGWISQATRTAHSIMEPMNIHRIPRTQLEVQAEAVSTEQLDVSRHVVGYLAAQERGRGR
jgi:hypothetical protein